MAESVTEPKRHLALDTDWICGTMAAGVLIGCLLLSGRVIWQVLTGANVEPRVSWYTVMLLFACIWAVTATESRILRLGFALVGLAPASRLALYLTHASIATQMMNAEVMRVVDAIALTMFCVYLVQWFKTKIKHV
jgi:hypothetical protein